MLFFFFSRPHISDSGSFDLDVNGLTVTLKTKLGEFIWCKLEMLELLLSYGPISPSYPFLQLMKKCTQGKCALEVGFDRLCGIIFGISRPLEHNFQLFSEKALLT